MPEPVNAYRYLGFLRSKWWFIALSCAVATGLALGVSLMLPKKYTATCRILVEAPAGSDPHGSMAVSSIYLESLKTYVAFAASDSLFQRGLGQFHLRRRYPRGSIESLKAGILKVAMIPDTKIMELRVTLPDPKTAQALAQYLAEETIRLNRTITQESDRDLTQGIEKDEADARVRLRESEAAWNRMVAEQPIERLQQEVQNGEDLKSSLERQILRAEADGDAGAQAETWRRQLAQVEKDVTAKEDLLAKRLAERDRLDTQLIASRSAYASVQNRLDQVRGELGYRGERLKIIDPGVVPEQPSSPNISLNVFAALLLGIVAPIVYLTLQLSFRAQRDA
jgi:uncharacterized protein involved in exopolysaccharide biosynthesis